MNCERERRQFNNSLPSVSDTDRNPFKNNIYAPNENVLECELKELNYWAELYLPRYYEFWKRKGTEVTADIYDIQLENVDDLVSNLNLSNDQGIRKDILGDNEPSIIQDQKEAGGVNQPHNPNSDIFNKSCTYTNYTLETNLIFKMLRETLGKIDIVNINPTIYCKSL
jgi:hypothetical protein